MIHWEQFPPKQHLRTFPKNYTVLCAIRKHMFPFPVHRLVISSFSRYLWSKIIISMPFDSSNQLFCHESLVFPAHITNLRHIEPFLHEGDAADAFVLRPTIFGTTLIQRPYLYITQRPLFSGVVLGNHSKSTTFWGN